jgi:hypothetical protein
MYQTLRLAVVATAIAALAACAEAPTEPRTTAEAPSLKRDSKAAERAALLTNVPVGGTLSDGGSFAGTFTATHLDIDPVTRQLSMSGVLNGTATLADGSTSAIAGQAFTAPVNLSKEATASASVTPASNCAPTATPRVRQASFVPVSAAATCDVLFLDLGPLHLDLLGLTVDLAEVILDINAVSGAGNLLGNLLCGLLGLLDGFALLAAISQFLDLINNILAGLSSITSAALISPDAVMAWMGSSSA